ncbi:hypothetical protein DPMN_073024 [Dreissena polymorpha]|uniref:Uncharacterized protein n=1 Tax=Dreissena polymorpha TaxID=45954 RepID=A0A9D4BYA6_DREPO|nr:hypothetical protein DPMN_073024 [Dreissena polymorpha]
MSLLWINPAAHPPAIKDDTLPLGLKKDSEIVRSFVRATKPNIKSNIADSVLLSQFMRDNGRCNISHAP